jgi:hypothetical protein
MQNDDYKCNVGTREFRLWCGDELSRAAPSTKSWCVVDNTWVIGFVLQSTAGTAEAELQADAIQDPQPGRRTGSGHPKQKKPVDPRCKAGLHPSDAIIPRATWFKHGWHSRTLAYTSVYAKPEGAAYAAQSESFHE